MSNGEASVEVSVGEREGVFRATTGAGKYEVSVMHDSTAFPPVTEVAFCVGEKAEIIKLDAKNLGNDAETIKSSLEEAALRFRDLIQRGFSPDVIQKEMTKESMKKDK